MTSYLWVMLGSGLGGAARLWCTSLIARHANPAFPFGTIAVNIAGSAFIGFFATLTGPDGRAVVSPSIRLFVMPGICGGFTTFSAFSQQTVDLARDGQWGRAVANVLLSVCLCLAGTWLGHLAARK